MVSSRPSHPAVLSASRRTDIPAFYLDWFMRSLAQGVFEVENPYNHRRRQVPARPREVHSIVFWSKNYGPFLKQQIGERLARRGYRFFFNFTINDSPPCLEPHVPPLAERLQQFEELANRFGPQVLFWRFDPICFYRRRPESTTETNLGRLRTIAAVAARLDVRECITSFADLYPKVQRRAARRGILFEDPPTAARVALLKGMAAELEPFGIRLSACCEKEIVDRMDPADGVRNAACIPGSRLAALFGDHLRRKGDRGQRVQAGCGCNLAIDIGSYQQQPCYHNCLFCYARPKAPTKTRTAGNPKAGMGCASAPSH
jgi:hypothetical protein